MNSFIVSPPLLSPSLKYGFGENERTRRLEHSARGSTLLLNKILKEKVTLNYLT